MTKMSFLLVVCLFLALHPTHYVRYFLDSGGRLVRDENDFVKFWFESDQNNAIEGWPKLDILRLEG